MSEYLYPGIYVEEKKFGTPPINGGSTSTGAFVGLAKRGQVGVPTFVSSWTDFVNKFAGGEDSPFLKNSYLAYQVYGFFNNGGSRAYIVRAGDGTEKKATAKITNTGGDITVTAKDEGAWGNAYSIKIVASKGVANLYDLQVLKGTTVVEVHTQLGLTAGASKNLVGTVNADSKFIEIDTEATTLAPAAVGVATSLAGGTDGAAAITPANLIAAMKKFDSVNSINLLVISDSQAAEVATEAVAYAEKRKDCVFIADAALADTFESVQTFKGAFNSEFMSLYYPWIQVNDPIGTVSKTRFVPTAGHVAGMIARTDANRGVFKAPAGAEATLAGVVGVKTLIGDPEQGVLNPQGINVIRPVDGLGIVVWGARTTSLTGINYLNVRRELNYVMDTLLNSTKWAVFEPNNADLWRKIRNQVVSFLEGRYQLGAYRGEGEGDAYFVKCDGELNTVAEINAGRVNTEVGVAINKPGEFIIFRVGQWDGGGSVS